MWRGTRTVAPLAGLLAAALLVAAGLGAAPAAGGRAVAAQLPLDAILGGLLNGGLGGLLNGGLGGLG